ncbi:MAG: tyrosine-type recombinase/integrase [Campylobacterales bacterium]|nr:tyrosine-type recombinase/integrase [Campylobacterales bacterium]
MKKIRGYKGLFYNDAAKLFDGVEEIMPDDLKRVRQSGLKHYEFVSRTYKGKQSQLDAINIDTGRTPKKALEEALAERINVSAAIRERGFKPKRTENMSTAFFDLLEERSLSQDNRKIQTAVFKAWIEPEIGSMSIGSVTADDLKRIVKKMKEAGKAARTQRLVRDYLSPVFKEYIERGVIDKNPAAALKITVSNKKHFELDVSDARKLYRGVVEWPRLQERVFFLFVLAGRRQSEVIRIRKEAINLEKLTYTVEGEENTKTKSSLTFPLLDEIVEPLRELMSERDDFLFVGNDGAVSRYTVQNWWSALTARLGLEMTMHETRNLIGHILIADGLEEQSRGALLGHATGSITGRYSWLGVQFIREWLERYFAILRGEAEPRGAGR